MQGEKKGSSKHSLYCYHFINRTDLNFLNWLDTEDKMVGWHHQLDGLECEQVPGVGDGQGSLACCSPWGCKESDTTERLN